MLNFLSLNVNFVFLFVYVPVRDTDSSVSTLESDADELLFIVLLILSIYPCKLSIVFCILAAFASKSAICLL